MSDFLDFFLHLDDKLQTIINEYGTTTYIILFLIIFVETGIVIMPFLPGDSLLFTAGALAANPANDLNVVLIILLLIAAALCGDNSNYFIGRFLAKKVKAPNFSEYLRLERITSKKHIPSTKNTEQKRSYLQDLFPL